MFRGRSAAAAIRDHCLGPSFTSDPVIMRLRRLSWLLGRDGLFFVLSQNVFQTIARYEPHWTNISLTPTSASVDLRRSEVSGCTTPIGPTAFAGARACCAAAGETLPEKNVHSLWSAGASLQLSRRPRCRLRAGYRNDIDCGALGYPLASERQPNLRAYWHQPDQIPHLRGAADRRLIGLEDNISTA